MPQLNVGTYGNQGLYLIIGYIIYYIILKRLWLKKINTELRINTYINS